MTTIKIDREKAVEQNKDLIRRLQGPANTKPKAKRKKVTQWAVWYQHPGGVWRLSASFKTKWQASSWMFTSCDVAPVGVQVVKVQFEVDDDT